MDRKVLFLGVLCTGWMLGEKEEEKVDAFKRQVFQEILYKGGE